MQVSSCALHQISLEVWGIYRNPSEALHPAPGYVTSPQANGGKKSYPEYSEIVAFNIDVYTKGEETPSDLL